MKNETSLESLLDPRGVRVLKRKLETGEISPEQFKQILKRQMLKKLGIIRNEPPRNPFGGVSKFFRRKLDSMKNTFSMLRFRDFSDPEMDALEPVSPKYL